MDNDLFNLPQFDSVPSDNLPKLNMCKRERERERKSWVGTCHGHGQISSQYHVYHWYHVIDIIHIRVPRNPGLAVDLFILNNDDPFKWS